MASPCAAKDKRYPNLPQDYDGIKAYHPINEFVDSSPYGVCGIQATRYRDPIDKTFKTRSKKQENIYEILKGQGSNYQIGNIEVNKIGVPPKMVYDLKSLVGE